MVLIFVDSLYIKKLPPMNFVWLGVLSLWPLIHYVYGIQYIQYMLYNIQYTSFSRECRLNIGEWFFLQLLANMPGFCLLEKVERGLKEKKNMVFIIWSEFTLYDCPINEDVLGTLVPGCDEYSNIFRCEYSFVSYSYNFFDANIFGYSFVLFFW